MRRRWRARRGGRGRGARRRSARRRKAQGRPALRDWRAFPALGSSSVGSKFGARLSMTRLSFLRKSIGKRLALRELRECAREIGLILLPVHLGIAEIEPPEADPQRDVGESVAVPHAPGLVAELGIHRGEPGADLAHLALDPRRAPQLRLALVLDPREDS